MSEQLLESVKSKYGAVAESTLSNDHAGVQAVAEAFGYTAEELISITAGANMGLSCGNPTATAHLRPGEVVVDLGSGGGLDVFLAANIDWARRSRHRYRYDYRHDRARSSECPGGGLHQRRVLSVHHRPDSATRRIGRLRDFQLRFVDLAPDKPAVFREIARVLKWQGRVAVSDIALKHELPEAVAQSMAADVGRIAGAIKIDDYRNGLLAAGFEHVEIVDSGADLNAYAKVENQAGCCSPAMDSSNPFQVIEALCCAPAKSEPSLHEDLTDLLSKYDVNAAAASVKVYAIKPHQEDSKTCCGPDCCA